MFNVQRIECNPLQENCYVVSDETKECVIIDCGAYYEEEHEALQKYIADHQLTPVHLLATHGHLDHNFGDVFIFHAYGLRVDICAEDQQLVEYLPEQARDLFGMQLPDERPRVGRLLKDGDVVTFGTHTLRVLRTPGHSHGSCLYYCMEEDVAFTGDTLFRMSIGRTDFAEGSWAEMERTLKRIVRDIPQVTRLLPGHGSATTMAEEVKHNPYLRR
jgi:glyoxylase-like metal-dependent hydrolase (beta-lactamase superfamily II)